MSLPEESLPEPNQIARITLNLKSTPANLSLQPIGKLIRKRLFQKWRVTKFFNEKFDICLRIAWIFICNFQYSENFACTFFTDHWPVNQSRVACWILIGDRWSWPQNTGYCQWLETMRRHHSLVRRKTNLHHSEWLPRHYQPVERRNQITYLCTCTLN